MNIMSPDHPRWEEFCERLKGPEGCHFRGEEGKTVWSCAGGNNKDFAKAILEKMGIDVENSLKFFEEHGGYCDCEVLFNI